MHYYLSQMIFLNLRVYSGKLQGDCGAVLVLCHQFLTHLQKPLYEKIVEE